MSFNPNKKPACTEYQIFDMRLPMPISHNALHVPIGDNKIGLTSRAKAYYSDMRVILSREDIVTMHGRIKAEIWVHEPDKRRRDINNLTKSLFDALQMCKVYADDHQIDETHIYRDVCKEGGQIRVRLTEIAETDDRKNMKEIRKEEGAQKRVDDRAAVVQQMINPGVGGVTGRFCRNNKK